MAEPAQSIADTRGAQMFPTLSDAEIARLERFGEQMGFPDGEALYEVGQVGRGVAVILRGEVEVTGHDEFGHHRTIVKHKRGSFMGELAQLSGRPSLVDAHARGNVEALVIPPERLRAVLVAEAGMGERIMRALILRRMGLLEGGTGGPVIVGTAGSADVLRLDGFLTRNGHPHSRMDPNVDADAKALVERFNVCPEELPIVLCPDGELLRNPTLVQLGRCLGLVRPIDPDALFDVAVVGVGPSGLATSVYAASEGLSVVALDCRAFGGQAGASARIENYLGFPTGITGMALMARAFNQAQKFGVEMAIPEEGLRLESDAESGILTLETGGGSPLRARTVVVATGARYRKLDVPDLESFEGTSVHYWASPLEGKLCINEEVSLVGAGNSAGQAAVYLSEHAARVTVFARRADLRETMSSYLVDRIEGIGNIRVLAGAEVNALKGTDGALQAVQWRDRSSGKEEWQPSRHLFLFIGADPNTDWLQQSGLEVDDRGFVHTGSNCSRDRLPLETSKPGVFAVGDVRTGSVKRVAAAVGDGAQVVAAIHAYLARATPQSA